eukprot:CAMPEP_0115016966 /NCGR_PEP_ID=MMETSP0216-20121206/27800_1 /TAXON_ID=223996 /ORGANISM="Protocruzia adherens, Strain Boccale" /LENGTH=163 /DNA_ID=CAMNT_0002387621 /DNA_START=229 /DNA_END=720 /DNA_ORIENTATION=-
MTVESRQRFEFSKITPEVDGMTWELEDDDGKNHFTLLLKFTKFVKAVLTIEARAVSNPILRSRLQLLINPDSLPTEGDNDYEKTPTQGNQNVAESTDSDNSDSYELSLVAVILAGATLFIFVSGLTIVGVWCYVKHRRRVAALGDGGRDPYYDGLCGLLGIAR